jgi:hypothetical protein
MANILFNNLVYQKSSVGLEFVSKNLAVPRFISDESSRSEVHFHLLHLLGKASYLVVLRLVAFCL